LHFAFCPARPPAPRPSASHRPPRRARREAPLAPRRARPRRPRRPRAHNIWSRRSVPGRPSSSASAPLTSHPGKRAPSRCGPSPRGAPSSKRRSFARCAITRALSRSACAPVATCRASSPTRGPSTLAACSAGAPRSASCACTTRVLCLPAGRPPSRGSSPRRRQRAPSARRPQLPRTPRLQGIRAHHHPTLPLIRPPFPDPRPAPPAQHRRSHRLASQPLPPSRRPPPRLRHPHHLRLSRPQLLLLQSRPLLSQPLRNPRLPQSRLLPLPPRRRQLPLQWLPRCQHQGP